VGLLALGFLGAFALEELVRTSSLAGNVDVSVLGVSFGTRPAETVLIVAVGLGVVATALLLGGAAMLRARRLGRRSKQGEEELARASRLETTERLLEYRIELLLTQVRQLEEREAELSELESERTGSIRGDDVVVVPDASSPTPSAGSPWAASHSRIDEGERRR
jgi:hypothetical protein